MKQNFKAICFFCLLLCLLLSGCGGPSPEKITQAQETFQKLTEIHNQVVTAHRDIKDNSLDDKLVTLADKITQVETYNLNEMTDEEIDLLIETMNSLIGSYQEYLGVIDSIKAQEEAAVLTPVSFSLKNDTDFTFTNMKLYEKDSSSTQTNVISDGSDFAPGESLLGITIYRNAEETPWILELSDAEENAYLIELPVKDYAESGNSFSLVYDSEPEELSLIDKAESSNESAEDELQDDELKDDESKDDESTDESTNELKDGKLKD